MHNLYAEEVIYVEIGQEIEILISEPWDGGSVRACIEEEKDGIWMFYSNQSIAVGGVQTKRFYRNNMCIYIPVLEKDNKHTKVKICIDKCGFLKYNTANRRE